MNVTEYVEMISKYERDEYFDRYGAVESVLRNLEQKLGEMTGEARDTILIELVREIENCPVWVRIHLLSFCMKVGRESWYTEKLLEMVLESDDEAVGEYNKLSHYWQISAASFSDSRLKSERVELLLAKLYQKLFRVFAEALGVCGRKYIPAEERNPKRVFVITSQVLELSHAPTKTLLDRCYTLQKYLNKEVTIINTAMQITAKGVAPFYRVRAAVYLSELLESSKLEFQGETFTFIQCKNEMPDLEEMARVINLVEKQKPYYIVDIGGSDICADLCGMLVPQITVSTVFSKVAISCGEYQIVDKQLNEHDTEVLNILGVNPTCVQKARFTFSFKEQTHTYTRKELGLMDGKFLLLIIGARLDNEADDEFLRMLEHVVAEREKIGVVFVGCFEQYENRMKAFPSLKMQSYNLGFQTDVLAVIECMDLYVNPKRRGGGSSVAEAMYKGLPAVTLPMGDVSTAAGEQFHVSDYDAMERMIFKYVDDRGFYEKMSCLARKRAEELMDSYAGFGQAIEQIEAGLGQR